MNNGCLGDRAEEGEVDGGGLVTEPWAILSLALRFEGIRDLFQERFGVVSTRVQYASRIAGCQSATETG